MRGSAALSSGTRADATRKPYAALVLTTFDLDEYAFAALRAGASGFLLKNAEPAVLLSAIRTVASGDAVVAPRVTRRLLEKIGARLCLSGATVKTHVGRILPKLGQRDRVQAVVLAYETGLVPSGRDST
jgi:DNA-binding NarL/FixJ family response regulator